MLENVCGLDMQFSLSFDPEQFVLFKWIAILESRPNMYVSCQCMHGRSMAIRCTDSSQACPFSRLSFLHGKTEINSFICLRLFEAKLIKLVVHCHNTDN